MKNSKQQSKDLKPKSDGIFDPKKGRLISHTIIGPGGDPVIKTRFIGVTFMDEK